MRSCLLRKTIMVLACISRSATSFAPTKRIGKRMWRSTFSRSLTRTTNDERGSDNSPSPLGATINSLLQTAISRAGRNLAYKTSTDFDGSSVQCDTARHRADETQYQTSPLVIDAASVASNYNSNPTISTIALAHLMWSQVLRPGIDSAIDATAGNGNDSLVLAELLFPSEAAVSSLDSRLFCIDIQQQACDATRSLLESKLPMYVMQSNVQVLHTSHAPLPVTNQVETSSITLVVYNLGFLPKSETKDQYITAAESTVASLADASLLLRIGGMLSVTTYPKTNRREHEIVLAFMEGLALFTSSTQDWKDYVESLRTDFSRDDGVDDLMRALERVHDHGIPSQTWRVYEHRKLGWTDAPVLLTATRIK